MAKVRVSQHSGRTGSAAHNDRTFMRDMTDRERAEKAPHINADATQENLVWSIGENGTLKERELEFYRTHYTDAIEATNARYRAQGHPERCRTIEKLYAGAQTRPEEMIVQIGDRDTDVNPDIFTDAVREYLRRLSDWNAAHGGHMHILNVSIHLDETSPHAHIRRVWDYTDGNGHIRLGQGAALKAAGVSLPHPEKAEGRYNNRKIEFDAWARGVWQEVARDHGFEIETEPRPSMRHKDKVDFVNDRLRNALEAADRAVDQADKILGEAQADVADREARIRALDSVLEGIRASGRLADRKHYKTPLSGEEYIRITPEEAKALDAAVRIKVPLLEAVEDDKAAVDALLRQTRDMPAHYQKMAQRDAEEVKRRMDELLLPRAQRRSHRRSGKDERDR